jgi:uncharacterized protein
MIMNKNTGTIIVRRLVKAKNFWSRFWGLMPRKYINGDEGLLLTPCNSVHTFFMSFPIDVVYLDSSMKVIAIFENVKPWRVLPMKKGGRYVLETTPGLINHTKTAVGDLLQVI